MSTHFLLLTCPLSVYFANPAKKNYIYIYTFRTYSTYVYLCWFWRNNIRRSLVPQSSQGTSIPTNPRNHSRRKWGIWWARDEWTAGELKGGYEVVSLADACTYNPWGHSPPTCTSWQHWQVKLCQKEHYFNMQTDATCWGSVINITNSCPGSINLFISSGTSNLHVIL